MFSNIHSLNRWCTQMIYSTFRVEIFQEQNIHATVSAAEAAAAAPHISEINDVRSLIVILVNDMIQIQYSFLLLLSLTLFNVVRFWRTSKCESAFCRFLFRLLLLLKRWKMRLNKIELMMGSFNPIQFSLELCELPHQ